MRPLALALPSAFVLLAADAPTLTFDSTALLGPFALLVAALIGIAVLWREDRRIYRERIEDLKAQRDVAAAGWTAQTAANAILAEKMPARGRTPR